jgi:hypothetical protein
LYILSVTLCVMSIDETEQIDLVHVYSLINICNQIDLNEKDT